MSLKDKNIRDVSGQIHAIYELEDDKCAYSYKNLINFIESYKELLGRSPIASDILFPRCDKHVRHNDLSENMVRATFMKTVSAGISACGIIPFRAAGEELGK